MLSRALDFSPRLRHLTLAGLAGIEISLISPTLEMLDMRETGKGATLVHVECPQLRSIRQRYEPYGNGIRLFDPDTQLYLPMWEDLDEWLSARNSNGLTMSSCPRFCKRSGSCIVDQVHSSQTALDLPDECEVISLMMRSETEFAVRPTTTFEALESWSPEEIASSPDQMADATIDANPSDGIPAVPLTADAAKLDGDDDVPLSAPGSNPMPTSTPTTKSVDNMPGSLDDDGDMFGDDTDFF